MSLNIDYIELFVLDRVEQFEADISPKYDRNMIGGIAMTGHEIKSALKEGKRVYRLPQPPASSAAIKVAMD